MLSLREVLIKLAENASPRPDKAIVRALQGDGRLAYSQLGAQVGMSEAATRQRVGVGALVGEGLVPGALDREPDEPA